MTHKSTKSYGISLARIVCAFGILVYHYMMHALADSPLLTFANGNWGSLFVFVFFLISGYVMYLSNPEIPSLKDFYKKRILRLMPMFWMVYLVAFIDISLGNYTLSWGGKPATIIFSILGIDGLMSGYMPTYYIVGEWFLGVIILCNLFYPLFLKLFDKLKIWLLPVAGVLAYIALQIPFFDHRNHQNVMLSFAVFIAGMVLKKYELLDKLYFKIISILIAAVVITVRLPIPDTAGHVLASFGVLNLMYIVGNALSRFGFAARVMDFVDPLTYPIFLLHHIVLIRYISMTQPQGASKHIVVLLTSTILILIFSWALKTVDKQIKTRKL